MVNGRSALANDLLRIINCACVTWEYVCFDSITAGAMAQSVALEAVAEGLSTCVRASVDHDAFGEAARLQDGQTILLAQTLGVLL